MDALRPCGTVSAYNRHLSYGQTPCPECREARYRYQRNRDRARNEQAELFRQLIGLIAGVCREEGMLP